MIGSPQVCMITPVLFAMDFRWPYFRPHNTKLFSHRHISDMYDMKCDSSPHVFFLIKIVLRSILQLNFGDLFIFGFLHTSLFFVQANSSPCTLSVNVWPWAISKGPYGTISHNIGKICSRFVKFCVGDRISFSPWPFFFQHTYKMRAGYSLFKRYLI